MQGCEDNVIEGRSWEGHGVMKSQKGARWVDVQKRDQPTKRRTRGKSAVVKVGENKLQLQKQKC